MVLNVLLFILKIIGVALLCIIALAVLLSLLALFTRIKYNIKCGNDNGTYFKGNVSYLLGIVKAKVYYKDDELQYGLKIFGKRLLSSEPDLKESNKSSKKASEQYKDIKETDAENVEKDIFENKKEASEIFEEKPKESTQNIDLKKAEEFEIKKENKPISQIEDNTVTEKKISWQDKYSNIKYDHSSEDFTVRRVKINEIENKEQFNKSNFNADNEKNSETGNKRVLKEEEQKEEAENENTENRVDLKYFLNLPMDDKKIILGGLYKFLKRFCKTVLPKTVLINAKAGVGDPAGTGLMLALCGIFKGLFIEGLNVSGDFDNVMFLGNAEFSGRFTLGYLLYSAVCFIILKPVRRTVILFIKN